MDVHTELVLLVEVLLNMVRKTQERSRILLGVMNTAAWGSDTAQTAFITKHTKQNSKIPKGTQGTEHVS